MPTWGCRLGFLGVAQLLGLQSTAGSRLREHASGAAALCRHFLGITLDEI
jgi:hypothetical protein